MRRLPSFTVLMLTLISFAASAMAEKRVALVIGNSGYRHTSPLPNPRNDAIDVAVALKRLDFETIFEADLDKAGMDEIVIRFARAARDADVALFYYAGHAMQFGGVNYLMPVDVRLTDEADIRRMVRVDEIVADLQQARNLRVLVLDSCRNNPLAEEFKRSIGSARAAPVQRGLVRIESPQGTIVSFATQAGRTADDGKGRNSPYTTAFLKHIEAKEEIGNIFRNITEDVYKTSGKSQLPELSLSLIGRYYFKGRPDEVVTPTTPQPATPNEAAQAWAAIQNTTSVAVLEDFIRQFGTTIYGSMARARLEELKKLAVVVPPVPPATPPAPAQPAVGIFGVNPLSAAQERGLQLKQTFKECDACPEMVVSPAGSFTMGSPASEPQRDSDEGPQRRVTLSRQFAVGMFAVTVNQFAAFVQETGYDTGSECYTYDGAKWEKQSGRSWRNPGFAQSDSHPAVCINWDDAKAYVVWLSRKSGKTYRLLSEAEREYVARAGTTTPFWWGSTASTSQANYNGNYTYGSGSKGEYRLLTVPVDSFQPNPWGLYQVHGNVWEWVEDCYKNSYAGAPTDGSVLTARDCSRRVLRGGSWYDYPRYLRSANRDKDSPGLRSLYFGFRVARTLLAP
jgi:formylglycine-generating enzyme required for sulfatase activity